MRSLLASLATVPRVTDDHRQARLRWRSRPRLRGEPRSSNGASSLHLWWTLPGSFEEVAATLEVVVAPTVPRLYFWALQVNFLDGSRVRGGAHLGLQFHPGHPGRTAVNWGGYRAGDDGGGELSGSESSLPSALGNPNTRDFAWRPHRPYRLRVHRVGDGTPVRWRGEVSDVATGETTVVRDLLVPARGLGQPLVWSEVFARCDHPSTTVRWSELSARRADGDLVAPSALATSYQSRRDGGCDNTTSLLDGDGVLQVTATERQVPGGRHLPWGR